MKKILFLSFPYPYAKFGPSTNCCVRIMKYLIDGGKYEVHCCSYSNTYGKKNFEEIPGIILHEIPILDPRRKETSKIVTNLKLFFKIPIYPFRTLISDYNHYRECRKVLKKERFDLIVSQCYSEQSLVSGVLLKKYGFAPKFMVIFWDNIYGLLPQRVIPQGFALRRQRKAESWIAKYADKMVSLYPIKPFHEKHGDVPNANGKRIYLGIPSLLKPISSKKSVYADMIKGGKINILYSGTIYSIEQVNYLVQLLNTTSIVEQINLVFFSRGLSKEKLSQVKESFYGTFQQSDWIPLNELLALYPLVDLFVSFPGNPNAIRSKVYEYMSYGKPVMIMYDDDFDVNSQVFAKYPASLMIDVRKTVHENNIKMEDFFKIEHEIIPFDVVEKQFKTDTPKAYLEVIDELLGK